MWTSGVVPRLWPVEGDATSEVDGPAHLGKPDRSVGGDTYGVVKLGIGSQMLIAAPPAPAQRVVHKQSADPVMSRVGIDVPPFDVANRPPWAPFGPSAFGQPYETAEPVSGPISHGDLRGRLAMVKPMIELSKFLAVVIGPKLHGHAGHLAPVLRGGRSNERGRFRSHVLDPPVFSRRRD